MKNKKKYPIVGVLPGGGAAAPALAQGAAGAVPRLDKRTYLNRKEKRWKVILRDYGDGLCEVGWSFQQTALLAKAGRGQSEQRLAHEDRAGRRARSRLRQLVLSAKASYLLTLTYQENVTDYAQSCADLGRFIRKVKKHLPGWVYVAVPEQQARGAWHWHLAVIGRQDVRLLRHCWLRIVGRGNIDVKAPKSGVANQRLAIIRYLGKYLSKGFVDGQRDLNGHRFRASLGIKVPGKSIAIPPEFRADASQYVQNQLREHAGSVGFVWVDQQGMVGWACSWT